MRLEDTLHNCLIALIHRFPDCKVEANKDVLEPQHILLHDGTPAEILEQIESAAPELLLTPAHMEIEGMGGEIFIMKISQEVHTFLIHLSNKDLEEEELEELGIVEPRPPV